MNKLNRIGVGKRLVCIILSIILVGIMLIPGSALADWKNRATLVSAPASAYISVSTTFQYTLSNTGTASFDTVSVEVIYDWMAAGLSYQPTPQVVGVPPGGSHTWNITIIVPSVTTGAHTATVNINAKGGEDLWASTKTWTMTHQIIAIQPLSLAISGNPTSGVTILDVDFSSTVGGGLTPYSYSWTYGDGSSSDIGTSTFYANPSHSFMSEGTFTVTCVVQDSSPTKQVQSKTTTITVTSPPLEVGAVADHSSGMVPYIVGFTPIVNGGKSPYTYSWTFGDGSSSGEQYPSHTYTTAGTFTATLTVTDSSLVPKTKIDTTTITVTAAPVIIVTPSVPGNLQASAFEGKVTLTWSTPSSDGGAAITNYKIYRGLTYGLGDYIGITGTELTYTDSTVTKGETYYYYVCAVNSIGTGAKSSIAEVTTPSPSSSWLFIILAAIIIIIAVVGVVAFVLMRKKAPKAPTQWNAPPQQQPQQPFNQQPPNYPPPPPTYP